MGSIIGLERSPGGEHGSPLQYSCLESPMDRGAWRATVHRVTKGWTRLKQLSMHACNVYVKFTVLTILSAWFSNIYIVVWLASLVAQTIKNLPAMWETWVPSLGWEDPPEKEMTNHSCILPWRILWMEEAPLSLKNPRERGVWWATVHGVTESDMTAGLTHTHSQSPEFFAELKLYTQETTLHFPSP